MPKLVGKVKKVLELNGEKIEPEYFSKRRKKKNSNGKKRKSALSKDYL